YPCDDDPEVKAFYEFTMVTDAPYEVVAPGLADAPVNVGGSRRRWRFVTEEPMASYLATVNVGQFKKVELPCQTSTVVAWVPSDLV
ncbi:hypothetical protein QP297_26055, partial [Escherichia coli]|nr:hypothetical protein [Escherichia coli]